MQSLLNPEPVAAVREWPVGAYLNVAIFLFFALFAILLPWSIKGARYAWMAAFCLWLIDLVVERKRLRPQPLALPMLAYILLSGISCVTSYDPYMSWPHMKVVCWTALIATLFAQNLSRFSSVRTLILLLLLSAATIAGFTAWQYWKGIGLRITDIVYRSPLHLSGLRPGDILVSVNGHSLHTAPDLLEAVAGTPPDEIVSVRFLRGFPVRRKQTFARAADFVSGGHVTSKVVLAVATPVRAQGTLGHPGILAETLAPIACLAWALLLGSSTRWRQLLYAVIFLAVASTLVATQSRAPLTGLLAGCLITSLIMSHRRARVWLVLLLIVIGFVGGLWIHDTRGLSWVDLSDPGMQYRLMMWEDGARLAIRHPLVGVGMDTVQNHWPEWRLHGFAAFQEFWNFHSEFVQIAAERGLLTLAAWLWFVIAYIIYLAGLLPRIRRRTRFGWAVTTGILAGFVAFLCTSFVQSSLGDDTLVMLLFFCFGLAAAMDRMLGDPLALDVA